MYIIYTHRMSTNPAPTWPPAPYGMDHEHYLLNNSIYQGTSKILGAINETNQFMSVGDAAGRQAASDTARDIMRNIDQTSAAVLSTTERVANQLATSTERNSGNIMTAIEKVAGEGRMTTTVVDAATRQANADSARDILVSVERNGSNAVNAAQGQGGNIMAALERTSGDAREHISSTTGALHSAMTDVRHSVLNDISRSSGDILSANTQNLNVLTKAISDAAWETRSVMNNGFTVTQVDSIRNKEALALQISTQHSLITKEINESQAVAAQHYSALLLEQHRMKEYLSSKGDNQFAMTQLEAQKSKSELAQQASNHFAVNQLEQQKVKEVLSAQMAEAKYEALKSQQFLADKMCECCCEIKGKIDTIDRDRLRDNLSVANNDNNLLKVVELAQAVGGYGGYGGHGRRRRSRSRSRSRSRDRGDRR